MIQPSTDDLRANAERLLADAELLSDHGRYASAFALAVLGLEEVGKLVLLAWAAHGGAQRRGSSAHVNKQAAVATLLAAARAVSFVDSVLPEALEPESGARDEHVEALAHHLFTSREGQLLELAAIGAIEKSKHLGLYVDGPSKGFTADDFKASDVSVLVAHAREALALAGQPRLLDVGLAMWRHGPPPLAA